MYQGQVLDKQIWKGPVFSSATLQVRELTEAVKEGQEVRDKLQKEAVQLGEKCASLESANQKLAEMKSQLEADLTAVEMERREMEEQVASLRETGREDRENVRLLKEAKQYLEQEKARLEAELAEKELKMGEMGKTVTDGASRIAELGKE
jgi:chromosome segregation ATPase